MEESNVFSDKEGVRMLVELLAAKGVGHVVMSPGSRNAPLLISFARSKKIKDYMIVDERSAGFFALGLALEQRDLVALVCTSGSAILNYAPAVAEAWYERLPLIVISADRPAAWIDQDDNQTIRQNGVLANIVKGSWTLLAEPRDEEEKWYNNRMINDAVNYMMAGRIGPIHLNIPLAEPLYGVKKYLPEQPRTINRIASSKNIDDEVMKELRERFFAFERVMIVAGSKSIDIDRLDSISILSSHSQVVIVCEKNANQISERYIDTIDRVLSTIPQEKAGEFAPDLVISFDGALISNQLKTFIRNNPPKEHWTIDNSDHPADTFKCLTTQIDTNVVEFLYQLGQERGPKHDGYKKLWANQKKIAARRHQQFIDTCPWSDLKAFSLIMPQLPKNSTLHTSNGTPVRYIQLFDYPQVPYTYCNRGTCGIEGSTSTAIGATTEFDDILTLITGDISFMHDSNALWNQYICPSLRIIVMKNGGGGIFRFIEGPSSLPELEKYFETPINVNVQGLASTYGFEYYQATNETQLEDLLPQFFSVGHGPSILEVATPRLENANILKEYFKQLREAD